MGWATIRLLIDAYWIIMLIRKRVGIKRRVSKDLRLAVDYKRRDSLMSR